MISSILCKRYFGALILVLFSGSATLFADALEPSVERQSEIANMVLQDCGSCHGMTLKGGLGPALTADAIADKPSEMLVDTIIQGRLGTAMPPWNAFLSRDEAQWIVKSLKQGAIK